MARLGRAYPVKRLVAKPATVVIRSITVGSDTGLTASVSATTPADTQVGDVLLIFHVNDFYLASNMPAPTVSPGSPTANLVTNGTADAGSNLGHIKTYTALVNTDGAQTVSVTETGTHDEEKALVVLVLAGADQATPVDIAANSSGASATTQVAPSVTTTSLNDLLIIMVGSGGGSAAASYTTPTPLTEQTEIHVGTGLSGVLATEQIRATGATGTFSFTAATAVPWDVVTVTVHPGTVAPATPATSTPQPIVAGAQPYVPIQIPAVFITDVNAPAATVAATSSPQPLVVTPETLPPVVPTAFIAASQPLGNPATGTDSALVVGPPFVWCPTPPVKLSSATVLGNPAVGTSSPIVVTPAPAVAPVPGARILGPGAPTAVVATGTPQPLVVTTSWQPTVPPVTITASQPLGNPAVGTASPIVVTPPIPLVLTPPVTITASQPLGNPAVGTGSAMVVTPPTPTVPVPRAVVIGPGAPATVVAATPGTQPLVVSTPWSAKVPGALISSSQPLGNAAVGSPQPLVVSTAWTSRVPGALLSSNPAVPVVSTVATPGPLVVGPPYTPVPVPPVTITASQPLGRPATSTPNALVVSPTFTLAPIPGAAVFAAPTTPTVTAVAGVAPLVATSRPGPGPVPKVFIFAPAAVATTPNALVVGPPFTPVPVPGAQLNSSLPLGQPAVGTRSAQVIGPPFAWTPVHITRLPLPQTPPSLFVGALDTTTAGSGADSASYGSVTADQATAATGLADGSAVGGGELDGGTAVSTIG